MHHSGLTSDKRIRIRREAERPWGGKSTARKMQNYIDHQEERIQLAYIKLKLSITAGINLWAAVPGPDVCLQRFSNDDECLGWTCSSQVAQSGSVSALIFGCCEKIYVFVSLKHTNRQNQRPLSRGIPRYWSAQHRIPERSMSIVPGCAVYL